MDDRFYVWADMNEHVRTITGRESLIEARIQNALVLLKECLSDEEPWPEDDLVERMEEVYVALGGDLNECS